MSPEPNHADRVHEVSGKGFKHLTQTSEALKIVIEKLPRRRKELEQLPVASAIGRILGEDLVSHIAIPPFDRAAMDGFAVQSEDTYGATASSPVILRSAGKIDIGVVPTRALQKSEAAFVVTGGQMPEDSDAVVMVEHANQTPNGIEISSEVHSGENVSRIGEDVEKGTTVLRKGARLLPQDIGMLTYLGQTEVLVKPRLKISVLSTGNELQDHSGRQGGKIPDLNRPILLNAIREVSCEPIDMGIATDEFNAIRDKLKQAIEMADIILVTAGTSVGPGDIVPEIIDSLGEPGILVHGVAMRPSMPTGLGIVNEKPIISLPGYPVSAYIAFLEFVPPLIHHLLGTDALPGPVTKAKLRRRVAGVLGSRTYVRVQVAESNGELFANPVRTSGAGILSSLVQANGFIIVPEHLEGYEEDQTVEVELFRPPEREAS